MRCHGTKSNMEQAETASGRGLSSDELDRVAGGDTAPRDVATGMATGRRIQLPIQITTPVGTAP